MISAVGLGKQIYKKLVRIEEAEVGEAGYCRQTSQVLSEHLAQPNLQPHEFSQEASADHAHA